jgi:hypothetical protein
VSGRLSGEQRGERVVWESEGSHRIETREQE